MVERSGDVAAIMIGAGVLGFSIFSKNGPYEEFDFGLSIAILLILLAYIWPVRRTFFQSVAVACVIGGCTIPIVGYLIIAIFPAYAPKPGEFWDNAIGTVSWILFGAIALITDLRINQVYLKNTVSQSGSGATGKPLGFQ